MNNAASTLTAAAILAAAFVSAPADAQSRTMVADDLTKIVGISAPHVSPDGKAVAVVLTRTDFKNDKMKREIDLVDVATKTLRPLTYERSGVGAPAWSPDGTKLAFIADVGSGDDAKAQVFVMRMNGGDARPVTSASEGVSVFAWRPDGAAIAYGAIDAKPKKTGANRYRDAFVVGNAGMTARSAGDPVHLWIVPLAGGKAKQLTRGAQSIASSLSFSHDGASIALLLAPNTSLNDEVKGHIAVVNAETGAETSTTGNKGFESDAAFAPVGGKLAYVHSSGDSQVNLNEAYVTAPGSGTGTSLTHGYDRQVHGIGWSADGSALYFTCADGTDSTLVRASLDGKTERVDLDGIQLGSGVDGAIAKDGTFAFIGSTTASAPELYVRSATGTVTKLTELNAPISALTLAKSETITFPTSMGLTGDGVVLTPPGYTSGKSYPLVLIIHGGPTSATTRGFDRFGQLAAARGWVVLEPNYRGSDNHGLAYQRGVLYDPEAGPGKDIAAAVDAVKAKYAIDPKRIAVSGWSYGGIMTAWMITHYHFFRAAVSGASVNDWTTDYTTADDMDADVALFHGSPFVGNNRAEYNAASAVYFAKDVTTPTLILSDNGDNRDPIPTSYMFYRALKDNNKDVTFVAYPVAGHFPADPVRALDVYTRWLDYIAKHL